MRARAAIGVGSLGLPAILAIVAVGCSVDVAQPLTSPVDGIVTQVQATGLTEVQGFTLRIAGGKTIQLTLGPLENATQFSPGHLKEHQASGSPVRVFFTASGSTYTVYRLEDAPISSSSP
jgi:hypothetical protein